MGNIRAISLPDGIFDRSPAVIKFNEETQIKGATFRYCEIWSSCPEFKTHLLNPWNKNLNGNTMLPLVKKLRVLKGPFKKMHRSKFGNVY